MKELTGWVTDAGNLYIEGGGYAYKCQCDGALDGREVYSIRRRNRWEFWQSTQSHEWGREGNMLGVRLIGIARGRERWDLEVEPMPCQYCGHRGATFTLTGEVSQCSPS